MESLAPYLDELKKAKGLQTDTQVAQLLGVSRQHVSRVRAGDYMGEEKCYELAEMLDRDPLELISLNWAIRSDNKKLKRFWLSVFAKTKSDL